MSDYTKVKSSLDEAGAPNEPIANKAVLKNRVAKVKKSPFKKFVEQFFAGDLNTIKEYAIKDVLIPAGKQTFQNLVNNAVSIMLYGEVKRTNAPQSPINGKYTSYSSYYEGGLVKPKPVPTSAKRTDYRGFLYPSESEAKDIVNAMIRHITTYDFVRVSDLCDFCLEPHTAADFNYGWYDLPPIDQIHFPFVINDDGSSGYLIDLPSPVPITRNR